MIGLQDLFRRLIHRPIGVLMVTLAVLVASLVATARIPVALLPAGLSSSSIQVSAAWPGAHPNEVETRVVRPLEEELRGLKDLTEMRSRCSEGRGSVSLTFTGDTDMDVAYAEVADRIERARARLPVEVDRVLAQRWSGDAIPVLWCGILVSDEHRDSAQNWVAELLIPRLEAVDGVAQVNVHGLEPRSVRILVNQERAAAARVDLGSLFRRLQADNLSLPAGDLEEAGERWLVRVDGRFRSAQELENFPLGNGQRLADIARVLTVRSIPESFFRVDGSYALGMAINKETAANTFEVCARLRRVLEDDLPKDPILGRLQYNIFFSEGDLIGDSLRNLVQDAAWGGLLACLVLWLFLRRIGSTLLVASAIPFSVLATLAWLWASGGTFNLMSLMGITISIGMLVDNAVVIVESIVRRRERGEDVLEACVRGPADMVLAVATATLTTVIVFLPPIFLAEGRDSKIFATGIGGPLCVAILAALALAILVVPVASRFLRPPPVRRPNPQDPKGTKGPMPTLAVWALRHRVAATCLALAFLASGPLAKGNGGFQEGLSLGGTQMEYEVDFVDNASLRRRERAMLALEAPLLGTLNEALGSPNIGTSFSRGGGSLFLWPDLPPSPEAKERIESLLKEHLPKDPLYKVKIRDKFSDQGSRDRWQRLGISGPDSMVVASLAEEARSQARNMEVWEEVADRSQPAQEILVRLDRERLHRLGGTSRSILNVVEYGLRGMMVSRMQYESGDIPLIMEFDEPEYPDRERLRRIGVLATEEGRLVSLDSIAEFENRRAPAKIRRRNGKTEEILGLKHASKDLQVAGLALEELMGAVSLPEGYHWESLGGWAEFQKDSSELGVAFLLAVALVFLLMGLLFESLVLPLSVLITIPFAIVGSQWAFALTGLPMDLVGMIGMIVLAGIVVNNGIVLLDRILRLEGRGMKREEAVRQAVSDRLRPVLMTALTTIAGLLPIALSTPDGSGISFRTLAVGVSGGLAFTTFFTLWVVPLLYSLFQDLGRVLRTELLDRVVSR